MYSYYRKRKRTKITPLIVLAFAVHIILLLSVLDIYFTSPLEHGMNHHRANVSNPPAKRLVLLLADGLRASALYNNDMSTAAPFLYSIKENEGAWGIAHTQVPTESRPGHIAVFAGFYEDPSAIFKGWRDNPVDFDTVINQSSRAVCFGSPDIVNMFNKYNYSHISSFSYDSSMEDFSGKWKSVVLDQWVIEHTRRFIEQGGLSTSQDRLIVFLHLLGIDTAGHSFKPVSMEYKLNIEELDNEINLFVKFFKNYFRDNDTAFIFTSDHGMTDWGSHGAGSKDETEVPFIAWGSGITKSSERHDLNLTDIAPLIAALLGINFPTNSLGITPLHFLNAPMKDIAQIIFANALQLHELFKAKEEKIRKNPIVYFKPFYKLPEEKIIGWKSYMENLLNIENFQEVIKFTGHVINDVVEGIKYYNSYFQIYLSLLATFAFTGWLLYLISWLPIFSNIYSTISSASEWSYHNAKERPLSLPFIFLNIVGFIISKVVGFAYYYSLYVLFPVMSWYLVYIRSNYMRLLYNWLMQFKVRTLLLFTITYGIGTEMLIWTFFYRQALIPVVIANMWYICRLNSVKSFVSVLWPLMGLAMCCTLFLPVMNTGYIFWNLMMSFVMCTTFLICTFYYLKKNNTGLSLKFFTKYSTILQIFILIGAYVNTFVVKMTIHEGYGLQMINQAFSWFTLGAAFLFPLLAPETVGHRLISIIMALIPVYILLSGGIEPIFVILFSLFTFTWVFIEKQISNQQLNIWTVPFKDNAYSLTEYRGDMRKVFAFFSFIMLAFFGTGNLSSINSFDPTWTQTFVTVYRPYVMTALIGLKITIPFLILMCCFLAIVKITNVEIKHVFTLLLLLCDCMVLHFFFAIENQGSWLDIGMSLSRFIIALVTTLTVLVFYFVSKILTSLTTEQVVRLIKKGEY